MKRILFTTLVFAAFLSASCTKDYSAPADEGLVEMSFSAGRTATSRSGFDGTDVVWTAGDKISIFDSSLKNRRFATTASGASAVFTGRARESASYYALYPYLQDNAMSSPGIMNAHFLPRQRAVRGSWADSVNVSVGKVNAPLQGSKVMMKNAGGYVKINLAESTDRKVAISL